ncbi:hypothetical protein UFOVP558_39 [uncultured Caudovirales phage]|uniref:Uncharacterized protein n=1 Tax=uncultured Caudovirales phage TaxID=2100421 RepID=A0A6J5MV38_9CAUD|nr:hypothetical protein UFOVP558_39 [uncultured Caudovirales phage]
MNDMAVIHALWIGEKKPDRVSQWIQNVIGANYSHNAFIFEKTGMLWEATFDDEEKNCGVVSKPPRLAMQGCIIRARKKIELVVTNDYFEEWLEEERGKRYSQGQNAGTIWAWTQSLFRNGDDARNCSELLAAACQFSRYKFPRCKDYIKPTDTFKVIQPDIVDEVVDANWRFRL